LWTINQIGLDRLDGTDEVLEAAPEPINRPLRADMCRAKAAGFGTVIIINPSKDLALFIAVNQPRPNPSGRGIEIVRHIHFR